MAYTVKEQILIDVHNIIMDKLHVAFNEGTMDAAECINFISNTINLCNQEEATIIVEAWSRVEVQPTHIVPRIA